MCSLVGLEFMRLINLPVVYLFITCVYLLCSRSFVFSYCPKMAKIDHGHGQEKRNKSTKTIPPSTMQRLRIDSNCHGCINLACKDGKGLCRGVADQEEKDVDVDEANVEGPMLCMEIPPSSKPPMSKSSVLKSAAFPKGLKKKRNKRKKSASKNNTLLPFSDTGTIGDLDDKHLVLYNESCAALDKRYPSHPFEVREFRKQNIRRIILLRQETVAKVNDVNLLVKEAEVIRKEMIRLGEFELAEYAYIILAQTIKDKQHVVVLTKCPTVPRGDRASQSVEMLAYGDIVDNATYKVLEELGCQIPNHGNNYGGPTGIQHYINLNLRRICSAVIAAYRRRSSVVVNSDDDDSDDDDSTYVPEEECCDSDEEEAESLGIFLSMVHKASKKLGGKGLVVLDASGVSSKTNNTLWKRAKYFDFGDMRIFQDMYHPSMYVWGRGHFEETFVRATANCKKVSSELRRLFPKEDDTSPHGRFFEDCADRADFLMVGRDPFDKEKFHREMGKMGFAALLRSLINEGIDIGKYFSELGKIGYQGLVEMLESKGICVSDYFSDLGRRSYAALLCKLEAEKMSVNEYFRQMSMMRLDPCSTIGCEHFVIKAGYEMCWQHRPVPFCSSEGCTKRVRNGGVCVEHGATVAICSTENCTNQVQKGGVCMKHGEDEEEALFI